MPKLYWTPDKIEQIRTLAKAGGTSNDIARALGLTASQVHGVCWREKIPLSVVRNGPINWTTEMNKRLSAMAKAGLSNKKIGDALGVSESAVRRRVARLREAGTVLKGAAEPEDTAELTEDAIAKGCAFHLADLQKAYPNGPPSEVAMRRTFVLRHVPHTDAVLP